jgi:hypothetical protein
MKVKPEETVAELMERFPNGFAVGPGSPEEPGCLNRVLMLTSHLHIIAHHHPMPAGNQGYMVVDIDPEFSEGQ